MKISAKNLNLYLVTALCWWHFGSVYAQVPPLQWALQTSGPQAPLSSGAPTKTLDAMAIDHDGNILVSIRVSDVLNFAGMEIYNPSLLGNQGIGSILVKLDPSGNPIWFRTLKGPWQSNIACNTIDVDAENNIYIGYYGQSQLENASSIGGLYVMSPRTIDNFIVKLSPDGEGLWYSSTLQIGGIGSNITVKSSPDGGVYFCGTFPGSVNFNGVPLVNQNLGSLFLVKFDDQGNVLWNKVIYSLNGYTGIGAALETASDGSVYLSGYWEGDSLNIDHLSVQNDLAFTLNSDRWIAKIGPDGTAQWLVREHSVANQWLTNIAVTPEDDLLVLSHKGADDLFIGDYTVSNEGVVLSHYSAMGEVISASLLGGSLGSEFASPPSIVSNGDQSYFLCGGFSSPTYMIGGLQISNLGGSTGTGDAYVLKMNAAGEAEWMYSFGSEESEFVQFVEGSEMDRVVLGGSFFGFELDIQGTTLTAHTPFMREAFVASFSTALATSGAEALKQLLAYPNPFSENVQFDAEALQAFGNATLLVFNTNGVEVYRKQLQGIDAGQISLAHLPQGAYVARISDGKRSLHTKIIKQ